MAANWSICTLSDAYPEVKNIARVLEENKDALLVLDFHTNGSGCVEKGKKANSELLGNYLVVMCGVLGGVKQ